jgi:hypothetical protein
MIETKKRGRPRNETGGLLDASAKRHNLPLRHAVAMMFNTANKSLEALSKGKINSREWGVHKVNYDRNSVSMDKQIELLQAVGFVALQPALFAAPTL